MAKHTIILPDPQECLIHSNWRIHRFSSCFRVLPLYDDDIEVQIDKKNEHLRVPGHTIFMGDGNGCYSGFFRVNNNLFMIIDTDHPIKNSDRWIPHYAKQGVKGFFLACHRYSTEFIFKDSKVPVFPLGGKPGPYLPLSYLEGDAHSKSVTNPKNINVFFSGQFRHRPVRALTARNIERNIPNVYIQNTRVGGTTMRRKLKSLPLSGRECIDLMIRSKIVWCPRSAWSDPEHDCNAPICKEWEAMCLETLVIKHSIGIMEVELRIPGVHFIEIQNNDLDLIEKIQYYLEHENERKEIAHNGRLYYERNCSSLARAKQILADCLSV